MLKKKILNIISYFFIYFPIQGMIILLNKNPKLSLFLLMKNIKILKLSKFFSKIKIITVNYNLL